MSHGTTPTKIKFARAKSGAKGPLASQKKPAGSSRSGTKQEAVLALLKQPKGTNDRGHHDGNRLAAAFGPRLLCRCGKSLIYSIARDRFSTNHNHSARISNIWAEITTARRRHIVPANSETCVIYSIRPDELVIPPPQPLRTRPIVHEHKWSMRKGATMGTRKLALPRKGILDR